jgi:PTS system galactitol-specific IIA component
LIWEELNPSLISTNIKAKDFSQVMEEVGTLFIKEGYAKDTYIEALIKRENEFPTGLDIDGIGVAIPHTDVSHVNKAGIGIGVLEEPVTFLQMGTDDEEVQVKLVFMLCITDPNKHIDELQRILEIIQDKEVLSKLIEVKNKEEIINIIRRKESSL